MSPEQATADKEISARSDVYSIGSVLYEMLTGNPPHAPSGRPTASACCFTRRQVPSAAAVFANCTTWIVH